jgi:hypothetical protein
VYETAVKEKNLQCRIPFGPFIKAKRKELGMKNWQVSKQIGLGIGVLKAVENRGREMPRGKVAALARLYGMDPRALEYHQRRSIVRGPKPTVLRTHVMLAAIDRCPAQFTIADLKAVLKADGEEMDYGTLMGAIAALKRTRKILLLTPNTRPKPSLYTKAL